MATRSIVPRADDEGGIGTTLKRWATGFIRVFTADSVSSDTLILSSISNLVISSGIITVTKTICSVDTEGGASTDDLITINGGYEGLIIAIRAYNSSRTIVIKETGNILSGGSKIELDDVNKYVLLIYDDGLSKWIVMGGSGGGGVIGPVSSTVGHIAIFNSTDGKEISDGGLIGFTRVNYDQDDSPVTLSAADLNGFNLFTNTGADAETEYLLTAGADGLSGEFEVTVAQYLKVTMAGTETCGYGASVGAAGGYVRSNVIGTRWKMTWNGTRWSISNLVGVLNADE